VGAREWFSRVADATELDSNGYYLYVPWELDEDEHPDTGFESADSEGQTDASWQRQHRAMSVDEKAENLLMGFSDLHLHLLVLVSSDLAKRVQLVYGDDDESAERRRREALRLIDSLR
jgi:hypothetical protein